MRPGDSVGRGPAQAGPGAGDPLAVDGAALGTGGSPRYEQVRRAGRGERRDYRLEPAPIARGGQAVVFRGTHKPTQVPVAFKRLLSHGAASVARMRREIEAARRFDRHPHVMPLLDADREHGWFVMPLATGSAQTLARDLALPGGLRGLVTATCLALQAPHREGWVHRDLKPDNLLRLDGRWTVADWGLGRRPRGLTSDHGRTHAGTAFGTEGFAAPEMSVNAHAAGPQADVYSIGQVVGWALTGRWPQANIALLPDPGPWRTVVREATAVDPVDRPADADALLALVAAELDDPAEPPVERGRRLFAAAVGGDPTAPGELLRLAARTDADPDLFGEVVARLDDEQVRAAVRSDPASVRAVVRALRALPPTGSGAVVEWLVGVSRVAAALGDEDLLHDTADAILRSGSAEAEHHLVRTWLTGLSGPAAATAAAAVRRHPGARDRLADVATSVGVDERVRHALRPVRPAVTLGGPERRPGPPPSTPSWLRRRRVPVAAGAAVAAAATVTALLASADAPGGDAGGGVRPPSASSPADVPRLPSELAGTPQLERFVEPWDAYPGWLACERGTRQEPLVDGRFPLGTGAPVKPTQSFSCSNGGNLTVMFGEYLVGHQEALQRYTSAAPPRTPVGTEDRPPDGVHVFQWDETRRAVVWSDPAARTIGLALTDSEQTDLVEVWTTYRR